MTIKSFHEDMVLIYPCRDSSIQIEYEKGSDSFEWIWVNTLGCCIVSPALMDITSYGSVFRADSAVYWMGV